MKAVSYMLAVARVKKNVSHENTCIILDTRLDACYGFLTIVFFWIGYERNRCATITYCRKRNLIHIVMDYKINQIRAKDKL